jgi:hypothetical protein
MLEVPGFVLASSAQHAHEFKHAENARKAAWLLMLTS